MVSCIFKTAFYAIVVFEDAITYIATIITNLQINFDFIPGALYRIFQIAVREFGKSSPVGGNQKFCWGRGDIFTRWL